MTSFQRSYSISTAEDSAALAAQICPDYSLYWPLETHKPFWPEDHDFLTPPSGYKPSKPHFATLRSIQRYFKQNNINKPIFCDLDGVLANFELGVKQLTGRSTDQLDSKWLWININKAPGFYANLEWLPEGQHLWAFFQEHNLKPIILTGANTKRAGEEKREWCAKHLGPDVPVICCKTKDKPLYCIHGSTLIDDREIVRENWCEKNGGKFIHFQPDKLDLVFASLVSV
jgi:hypothetical protein